MGLVDAARSRGALRVQGNDSSWMALPRRALMLVAILSAMIAAVGGAYFLVHSPVAFQKLCALRFVPGPRPELRGQRPALDVARVLGSIPYKKGGMVYEVDPRKKFIATIRDGRGNCSNLSFGLAYYMDERGIPYEIVHLMPPKGFLQGVGHTVVRARYELHHKSRSGIVDVLGGGLPTSRGQPLRLADLERGHLDEPSVLRLNERAGMTSKYYGNFLDESVIGVLRGSEVHRYFRFVQLVYLPLGSRRLEKMTYDGAAVVLGLYPGIYVRASDRQSLLNGHELEFVLARTSLWSMRVALGSALLLAAAAVLGQVRRRTASGNGDDASGA